MTTGRKTSRSTGTPAERVLDAFKAFRSVVLRDSMRQTIKFLHERNLSLAAVATLMALRERGDQTISTLAREIGLSVAAMSQLVERLVQDDLVRRTSRGSPAAPGGAHRPRQRAPGEGRRLACCRRRHGPRPSVDGVAEAARGGAGGRDARRLRAVLSLAAGSVRRSGGLIYCFRRPNYPGRRTIRESPAGRLRVHF
jgi:DNA-binding HxlR family transcriptional regulator